MRRQSSSLVVSRLEWSDEIRPVQRVVSQICRKCLRSIATKSSDRPKLLVCRRQRQSPT
jgi:hypothetical protein